MLLQKRILHVRAANRFKKYVLAFSPGGALLRASLSVRTIAWSIPSLIKHTCLIDIKKSVPWYILHSELQDDFWILWGTNEIKKKKSKNGYKRFSLSNFVTSWKILEIAFLYGMFKIHVHLWDGVIPDPLQIKYKKIINGLYKYDSLSNREGKWNKISKSDISSFSFESSNIYEERIDLDVQERGKIADRDTDEKNASVFPERHDATRLYDKERDDENERTQKCAAHENATRNASSPRYFNLAETHLRDYPVQPAQLHAL